MVMKRNLFEHSHSTIAQDFEMLLDIHDEITLELARLERRALEAVRKRMTEQQLGEAWIDLDEELKDDAA